MPTRKGSNMVHKTAKSALAFAIFGLALLIALDSGAQTDDSPAVVSFDNGDRIVASYHWKIEHRSKSPTDILVHQVGTAEGRELLATIAGVVGANPAVASVVAATIPLPHLDKGVTDNKGLIATPPGMTICKAGPIGRLEMSRAAWSASIVRNGTQDGLGYYTSVGTDPHDTHRIEGSFYIEFVKPVADWEKKFGCLPSGAIVWNKKDGWFP